MASRSWRAPYARDTVDDAKSLQRDFVGYGKRQAPPRSALPAGLLSPYVVVQFQDVRRSSARTAMPIRRRPSPDDAGAKRPVLKIRDHRRRELFRIWQPVRLLAPAIAFSPAARLPLTIYGWHPCRWSASDAAAAILQRAVWDVCCHGWRVNQHSPREEEERARSPRRSAVRGELSARTSLGDF